MRRPNIATNMRMIDGKKIYCLYVDGKRYDYEHHADMAAHKRRVAPPLKRGPKGPRNRTPRVTPIPNHKVVKGQCALCHKTALDLPHAEIRPTHGEHLQSETWRYCADCWKRKDDFSIDLAGNPIVPSDPREDIGNDLFHI